DDVQILTGLANHMAIARETAKAARRERDQAALQHDIEVAGAVQSLLLPRERDLVHGRLGLAPYYASAAISGAACWYATRVSPSVLPVVVGGGTGHGPGAAMVPAAVAGSYMQIDSAYRDAPRIDVVRMLNESLFALCSGAYNMTLSAAEIDEEAGTLHFV